jgi:hypothetical protein
LVYLKIPISNLRRVPVEEPYPAYMSTNLGISLFTSSAHLDVDLSSRLVLSYVKYDKRSSIYSSSRR